MQTSFWHIAVMFVSIVWFSKFTCAVSVEGSLIWNELCPDYTSLGSAQAVLDDGRVWSATVRRDGRFTLNDVPPGEYTLSVRTHNFVFDQVLVSTPSDGQNISKVLSKIPGTVTPALVSRLPYPIKLAAVSRYSFFIPHESFNVLSMFGNPMMLMMVVGAVLVFATPYLAKHVDPETLKEYQGKDPQPSNSQPANTMALSGGDRKDESNVKSTTTRRHTSTNSSKARNARIKRK